MDDILVIEVGEYKGEFKKPDLATLQEVYRLIETGDAFGADVELAKRCFVKGKTLLFKGKISIVFKTR